MKLSELKNYLGYILVIFIWACFITCLTLHPADFSEPISQYGYYSDTKWLFALGFTVFGVGYYFFARQLDRYWKYTSTLSIIGACFFALTGFIPYKPYAHRFILDAHNISVSLAALFYALPMLFISFSSAHRKIAQVSRYLFVILFTLVLVSFIVRARDMGIFYFQILTVLPFHIWVISVNTLLLEHQKNGMQTKL